MKGSTYKMFKSKLVWIANSGLSFEEMKKEDIFYIGWLWLQLNDKQVYDLIDTLKETPIISCIYSDGEDKRYQIAESAFVLIDNRK